ncbi:TrmO family methyltransferase [Lachnospiraceae bacterium ZAX-1]
MRLLTKYYNEYAFSNTTDKRMFNSNMILSYMDAYADDGCGPDHMADPNRMSDYEKLSSMFDLFLGEGEKELVLKLINGESVATQLMQSFTLSTQFSYGHFISLLYYLGLLTIKSRLGDGNYEFRVPNKVIQKTYDDYCLTYYIFTNLTYIYFWLDSKEMREILTMDKPYKSAPDTLGIFATRSPIRPNPIAVSIVNVLNIDDVNGAITVAYIDADTDSPILDIKPYTPNADKVENPIVSNWCAHWPKNLEESATFDWLGEMNR